MKNRILIIGANSFLGQELIKKLLLVSYDIIGVYNQNTDLLNEKVPYVSINELDSFKNDFDIIYVISAYIPGGPIDEYKLFEVNVGLVEQVISNFSSAKIVLCSSVSVYHLTGKSINEKSIISPNSSYGISKMWAELLVKQHAKYAIVRISSMYGIGMKKNTFLPRVLQSAINNNNIILYGDGSRLQNYVHVSEVANVLIKAGTNNKNDIYLAVGKESYSNLSIANKIKKNQPSLKIEFEKEDTSPSFVYDRYSTNKKLGIVDEVNIDNELLKLWNWIKES